MPGSLVRSFTGSPSEAADWYSNALIQDRIRKARKVVDMAYVPYPADERDVWRPTFSGGWARVFSYLATQNLIGNERNTEESLRRAFVESSAQFYGDDISTYFTGAVPPGRVHVAGIAA